MIVTMPTIPESILELNNSQGKSTYQNLLSNTVVINNKFVCGNCRTKILMSYQPEPKELNN